MTEIVLDNDVVTGLEVIEGIDFDAELSCNSWPCRKAGLTHEAHHRLVWKCAHETDVEFWCDASFSFLPIHPMDTLCNFLVCSWRKGELVLVSSTRL